MIDMNTVGDGMTGTIYRYTYRHGDYVYALNIVYWADNTLLGRVYLELRTSPTAVFPSIGGIGPHAVLGVVLAVFGSDRVGEAVCGCKSTELYNAYLTGKEIIPGVKLTHHKLFGGEVHAQVERDFHAFRSMVI